LALETRPFGDLRNLVSQGKLDVSPAAMDLLSQLRKPGSMVEVPKGFELRTLADMQRGAQVEFAAVRMQDGSRMLVRGNRFDVDIPESATRVIAHTHPGTSLFAVRPSTTDALTIGTLGKRSSLVITEGGYWVRFNQYRGLLSNQVNSVRYP
jgi:hypothetical protein